MTTGPRVWGDEPKHVINVDWDGTVVPAAWPERPVELMPGAAKALQRFHAAGHPVRIWTARINPIDPWTGERRPDDVVQVEIDYIRSVLDVNGLDFVEIYTAEGKPGGAVYIDDKAERYTGGLKSWDRLADKVLLRLSGEKPIFPHHTQEVTA
jgi:hypothetical protein